MPEEQSPAELSFTVYATRKSNPQPLIVTQLSFGRLMDEIVVPFQSGAMFFIDGAPVSATDLDRIKILQEKDSLSGSIGKFHWEIRQGDLKKRELYAKQYYIRIEALLREGSKDITAQVINAYQTVIKPKLKDYAPNKESLLNAAVKIFSESLRTLTGI